MYISIFATYFYRPSNLITQSVAASCPPYQHLYRMPHSQYFMCISSAKHYQKSLTANLILLKRVPRSVAPSLSHSSLSFMLAV